MATSTWDTILTGVRDALKLRIVSGGDADLVALRYVEIAADPNAVSEQLRGYPSLVVTHGGSSIDERYTGGGYMWSGRFTVHIMVDNMGRAHIAAVKEALGFERPLRDYLDNATLGIAGVERILWRSTGQIEPIIGIVQGQVEAAYLSLPIIFDITVEDME